jgi:hypothetical protein
VKGLIVIGAVLICGKRESVPSAHARIVDRSFGIGRITQRDSFVRSRDGMRVHQDRMQHRDDRRAGAYSDCEHHHYD